MVDELRDREGRLRSMSISEPWQRPKSVTLRKRITALQEPAEGVSLQSLPLTGRDDSELSFVIRVPDQVPLSGSRVRPDPDLLERFLCLTDASDADVQVFASQFGALRVFSLEKKSELEHHIVITESCNVWRYFAISMRSILRIGASFHAGGTPGSQDWDAIGKYPEVVERASEELEFEIDPLSPLPVSGELGWVALAYFLRSHKARNRKYWVRLLNSLLDLGRARPWVVWDKYEAATRPRLVFSGPGLFAYLALQLCLTALKMESLVLCSYCNKQYPPLQRAPKIGQRNFCFECRQAGVPVRIAQRDLRARRREKGN